MGRFPNIAAAKAKTGAARGTVYHTVMEWLDVVHMAKVFEH